MRPPSMGAHVRRQFCGKGGPVESYFHGGPRKKAINLLLHMSDVARKVCMAVGRDVVGNIGGAARISGNPRERFAPDAIDIL